MNPYISLIIPAYNRAEFLADVIGCVQKQTFSDFEVIVVDDASTDDTAAVIHTYLHDRRIGCVHRMRNGGPSTARETGIYAAQGDIIVYCDSDDILYPHALATIAQLYRNDENASFAACNHKRTLTFKNEKGEILSSKEDAPNGAHVTLQDFYDWRVKTTVSGFSHRREKFLGRVQWKSGFLIEDLEYIMQLAMLDESGFRYIPEQLLHYDQVYGGNGMCSGASYADYALAFGKIYELHKNDPLMKNPDVYLGRVEKYNTLHKQVESGEIPPPQYKYFPELWAPKAA